MKIQVIETVVQTVVLDVPDHLTGDELIAAVETAKKAHDESDNNQYHYVETTSWHWHPAAHFGKVSEA